MGEKGIYILAPSYNIESDVSLETMLTAINTVKKQMGSFWTKITGIHQIAPKNNLI